MHDYKLQQWNTISRYILQQFKNGRENVRTFSTRPWPTMPIISAHSPSLNERSRWIFRVILVFLSSSDWDARAVVSLAFIMTVLSAFMGRRHRSFVTQMQCSIEVGLRGSRARRLSMQETMNGPELTGRLAIPGDCQRPDRCSNLSSATPIKPLQVKGLFSDLPPFNMQSVCVWCVPYTAWKTREKRAQWMCK